jgi:threonine/homoserine/homoserine lactone efflux protein
MPHLAAFLLVACLIVITPGPDMAMVTKNAIDGGRRAALLTALGTVTGLLVWMAASAAGIVAVLRTSAVVFTVVKLCGAAYLLILGAQALLAARRKATVPLTADGAATENPAAHTPARGGPVTGTPAAGSLTTASLTADGPAAGSPAAVGRSAGDRATAGSTAGRAASLRRRLRGRRPPRLLTGPPWRQGLLCNLLNPKIAVLFTSLIPQFVAPGQSAPLQAAVLSGTFVAITLVWLTGYALAASAAQQVLRRRRVQRAMRAVTGTALVGLGVRLAAETR